MSEHQPSSTPNVDSAVNQSSDSSPDPAQLPLQKLFGSDDDSPNDGEDDWQIVEFPNAINLSDIPGAVPESEQSAPPAASGTTGPSIAPSADRAADRAADREAELLSLVRDLNECNDVLLARVTQLENALETAQTALQSEIERAQQSHDAAGLQKSQVTKAAQHQIAQLVSELDTAEQALRRQQLLNETLQTELSVSHDRIAQLERECALVQQQHGEQSQALVHAEAACRDLRSRLQRQQRYTLQFKVALEKSLNASPQRSSAGLGATAIVEPAAAASPPVVMPKAQRIQPWASDPMPFEPVDPHLESLIRGLNPRSQSAPIEEPPPEPEPEALDPETEAQLWQDLERVIDSSTATAELSPESPAKTLEDVSPATEPPLPPAEPLAEAVEASFEAAMAPAAEPTDSGPLPENLPANPFTEPSPWGQPLTPSGTAPLSPPPMPAPEPSLPAAATRSAPSQAPAAASPANPANTDYLPAMTPHSTGQSAGSSPAPVVYPLRPQKRVRSLSAVELPSFPKPKARNEG